VELRGLRSFWPAVASECQPMRQTISRNLLAYRPSWCVKT
jgi:hypothetical protein